MWRLWVLGSGAPLVGTTVRSELERALDVRNIAGHLASRRRDPTFTYTKLINCQTDRRIFRELTRQYAAVAR